MFYVHPIPLSFYIINIYTPGKERIRNIRAERTNREQVLFSQYLFISFFDLFSKSLKTNNSFLLSTPG